MIFSDETHILAVVSKNLYNTYHSHLVSKNQTDIPKHPLLLMWDEVSCADKETVAIHYKSHKL